MRPTGMQSAQGHLRLSAISAHDFAPTRAAGGFSEWDGIRKPEHAADATEAVPTKTRSVAFDWLRATLGSVSTSKTCLLLPAPLPHYRSPGPDDDDVGRRGQGAHPALRHRSAFMPLMRSHRGSSNSARKVNWLIVATPGNISWFPESIR